MPEFDKMFERVSGESERRQQEQEEKARREREEWKAQFDKDRDQLVSTVLPILEEAKRQFESKGVPVVIENNWSSYGPMFPEIAFYCEKDLQPNKIGGKYKPEGRRAFFTVKNGKLEVSLSKTPGQRIGQERVGGSDEEAIHRAVEEALNSYFQSIEEGERPR